MGEGLSRIARTLTWMLPKPSSRECPVIMKWSSTGGGEVESDGSRAGYRVIGLEVTAVSQ